MGNSFSTTVCLVSLSAIPSDAFMQGGVIKTQRNDFTQLSAVKTKNEKQSWETMDDLFFPDARASKFVSANDLESLYLSSIGDLPEALRPKNAQELPSSSKEAKKEVKPKIKQIPLESFADEYLKTMPSEVGVDYVPLANMLMIEDFKAADQFTRDNLIRIAGGEAQERGYVYWTEVPSLPKTDMKTMEVLWLKYSYGKFGFSVQKKLWDLQKGDFEKFCTKIGWTKVEDGLERKLKWFGANEFIYDLNKAVRGHLPLTSTLRGTTLLKGLIAYPLWEEVDWSTAPELFKKVVEAPKEADV